MLSSWAQELAQCRALARANKCPDILPVPLHKVVFLIKVTGNLRGKKYFWVSPVASLFCLFGDLLFINFII